jgi:hypothetical protein
MGMETNPADLAAELGCSLEIAAECIAKRPGNPTAQRALARLKMTKPQTTKADSTLPHCRNPLHADPRHRRSDGKCFLCERAKVWSRKNEE